MSKSTINNIWKKCKTTVMIRYNTVIILGAGASCPFGLPSGEDLTRQISFDFKDHFIEFMDKYHGKDWAHRNTIIQDSNILVEKFSRANLTIDAFLSINRELVDIGKFAILHRITLAEQKSKLPWEDRDNKPDWFLPLYRKMISDITDNNGLFKFGDNTISFITFNYDRLLEHVLFQNLRNSYTSATDSEIIEQLKKIPILHVYGKVADLPWQSENGYDYKHDFDFDTLLRLKDNIHTIGEQEFGETIISIQTIIKDASRLFFLGFGYARENLDVLSLPSILGNKHMIVGTAFKHSEKRISDLRRIFSTEDPKVKPGVRPNRVQIFDQDCNQIITDWLQ